MLKIANNGRRLRFQPDILQRVQIQIFDAAPDLSGADPMTVRRFRELADQPRQWMNVTGLVNQDRHLVAHRQSESICFKCLLEAWPSAGMPPSRQNGILNRRLANAGALFLLPLG